MTSRRCMNTKCKAILLFFIIVLGAPVETRAYVDAVPDFIVSGELRDGQVSALRSVEIDKMLASGINWYVGIPRVDNEKARNLFLQAAKLGSPKAKMWLARSYFKGRMGFSRDVAKGEKLAKKNLASVKLTGKLISRRFSGSTRLLQGRELV